SRQLAQFPDALIGLLRALILLGFLPLLLGYWLMQQGLQQSLIAYFSLGFSLIVLGGGLILKAAIQGLMRLIAFFLTRRAKAVPSLQQRDGTMVHYQSDASRLPGQFWDLPNRRWAHKVFVAVVGLIIVAYWALPFDVLARLGLPRFFGGIEIFFLAGLMMVLGTTWVLIAYAEWLIGPVLALCSRLPSLYILTRLASAYPLHRRFRTGLGVVMFSLVVFAMTVMAVITNAMQNSYTNIDTQTGGYDIQAVAYFKPLPDLRTALIQHGIDPHAFSAVGVRTATAVGVIQLSNTNPSWQIYPAQVVSGGFLRGFGLHLSARAHGFDSDAAVWQALQTHPNYALIDSNALPYRPDSFLNAPVYDPNASLPADTGMPVRPPGFDNPYTFSLSGVYQGDTTFPATPVWVTGIQAPSPTEP
ncbi:MAG TPA: hypothetical protein VFK47_14280, partial [Ktedonobacteraceae bacterium]|nr:hypothetical protein [Ktedonobacteraceae bacterium]